MNSIPCERGLNPMASMNDDVANATVMQMSSQMLRVQFSVVEILP